ncbi:MAG TPA: Ig-like domain repeat protein [Aggregatilineaceae bacterium]|nr:Ig-like domain repeat protein [Aggregatilineaceae bacterium]
MGNIKPTSTGLSLSAPTIQRSETVNLTASVVGVMMPEGATPKGSVTFWDGSTQMNANPIALSAGTATLENVGGFSAGVHALRVVYSGDEDCTASEGTASLTVLPVADVDLTISALPAAVTTGQLVTLTFTSANHGPDAVPSLTVTGTLPDGFTAPTFPAGCTLANQKDFSCTVSGPGSGASASVQISARAPLTAAALSRVIHASVTFSGQDPGVYANDGSLSLAVEPYRVYLPGLYK